MDEISHAINRDLSFREVKDHFIGDYFIILNQLSLNEIFQRISDGEEIQSLPLSIAGSKTQDKFHYNSFIRGIFNEDLVLQEIIFIISKIH